MYTFLLRLQCGVYRVEIVYKNKILDAQTCLNPCLRFNFINPETPRYEREKLEQNLLDVVKNLHYVLASDYSDIQNTAKIDLETMKIKLSEI